MKHTTALVVEQISKSFHWEQDKQVTIREQFTQWFVRGGRQYFQALEDVSFEVRAGECFGVIGHNGSGKSTLLKLLAGILEPDQGTITRHGSISPFLELGVGFHPDLSGRDNIYMNATLLGLHKKEIDARIDEIIAFAELEDFIDQKLKNYSSGMQVRLAFAVAIHTEKEILLMDEVLAVGDMHFQSKCLEYFMKAKQQGKTIILVGHDLATMQRYCDRVLLLDHGNVVTIDRPDKACAQYIQLTMEAEQRSEETKQKEEAPTQKSKPAADQILQVRLLDEAGKEQHTFATGDTLQIEVTTTTKKPRRNIGIGLYTSDGVYLFSYNTLIEQIILSAPTVRLTLPELPFLRGEYYINVVLFGEEESQYDDFKFRIKEFAMYALGSLSTTRGLLSLPHHWSDLPQ